MDPGGNALERNSQNAAEHEGEGTSMAQAIMRVELLGEFCLVEVRLLIDP